MDKTVYEDLEDMFASKGWNAFTKQLEELEDIVTKTAPNNALTNEQWQYARGQIHQLRSILGYSKYVELAWKQEQDKKLSVIESDFGDEVNVDIV